jgi:arginine decarboxylase
MDQHSAPLYQAILDYKNKSAVRFHVPGHKGRGQESFLSEISSWDVTEIPGLDDLHQPEEAIKASQRLAAEAFCADESFFLVGGSTAGNLALLLTACNPGEEVIVQRNVHKSVINGLVISQAKPVYLAPEIDEETGLPAGVSLQDLDKALTDHPKAKAVFLTNPSYYGMGKDLRFYAERCHLAGIPLLVDEAHGAHFGFSSKFPSSAIQAGASAAVQSAHKMLSALTMASMLHVRGPGVNRSRLKQVLAMLQSSSPSYPLMASLDLARRYIATSGSADLEQASKLSEELIHRVEALGIPWLQVVRKSEKSQGFDYIDPLKVTLRTSSLSFHGFRLKAYLEDHNIYPELADQHHVLLVLSLRSSREDIDRTIRALDSLPKEEFECNAHVQITAPIFAQEVVLTPHEAFYRSSEPVLFELAVGKVSGEMVVPYPPGVSVINPGERIDEQSMIYLRKLQSMGCRFHGTADPMLETIQVIKDL